MSTSHLLIIRTSAVLAAGLLASINTSIAAGKAEIHVGVDTGDLRGQDHRALQAAVDYAAGLGGGTVRIGPGRYSMRNALFLRSGVNIVGAPGQTVLVACDGFESRLAADGDCNERQITVEDASGFRVGDGVSIQDQRKGGFEVTTATLTEQLDADTFRISAPLYLDYMVSDKASARLVFPVVGGWNVSNVVVEGVTVEGNRQRSQPLNGCRGAGIYLFECADIAFKNCTVRNYNGDGVSFQVSQRVAVEDCRSEGNAGLGLHPGSGSQHPVVRHNVSIGNDGDGLFVCWRVKHGRFEENVVQGNKGFGISIGHKDSDNVFLKNVVLSNSQAGVLFRNETEPMGAHRNVFRENVILDNGFGRDGHGVSESVVIRGVHKDLQFRNNVIGYSGPREGGKAAIRASAEATGLVLDGNDLRHVEEEVIRETRR